VAIETKAKAYDTKDLQNVTEQIDTILFDLLQKKQHLDDFSAYEHNAIEAIEKAREELKNANDSLETVKKNLRLLRTKDFYR
jgi:uncharacterized protein (DUF3084 family)